MSDPPFKKSKESIPYSNEPKDKMVPVKKIEPTTASELHNRNDKRPRGVKMDKSKKAIKKKKSKNGLKMQPI